MTRQEFVLFLVSILTNSLGQFRLQAGAIKLGATARQGAIALLREILSTPTLNRLRLNPNGRDFGHQPPRNRPTLKLKRFPSLADNPTEPMTLLSIEKLVIFENLRE